MKLLIDNLDGLGAIDYSGAVDASEPLTIERSLNAPSTLKALLCLYGSKLATPVRRGRVVVSSDAGASLFTGYLTTEPMGVYAGAASEGPVYRLAVRAVSDEWLLDKQSAGAAIGVGLADFGGAVLKALTTRLDAGRLVTTGVSDGRAVGVFVPLQNAAWSEHAGSIADATYASYRVLDGAVSLSPAGSVVHTQREGDGTLHLAGLNSTALRELANDVTLSGGVEPSIYWTEVFTGDGTTAIFELAGELGAPNGGKATLLDDGFKGAAIDSQRWAVSDPGSHLSLSSKGLALSGGNGFDGQTALTAYDALELGGTNLIELGDVMLGAASVGVLGGLYTGQTTQANCFAGFNVRQSGGQTLIVAMVNGAEAGGTFALLDGHRYTLRIRVHCTEMQRVKQQYYASVNGQVAQFGGGVTSAPVALVFEVRDQGSSSNTPMTVLYDAVLPNSPARVSFVVVNSVQLFGSIGSVRVTRTGSAFVRSTDAHTGALWTRLVGRPGEGLDCSITSSVTGRVTFFPGRIPAVGEIVTVTYRGRRRAVARLADAASVAFEAAGGSVGSARWLGRVVRPAARSSEDCESAAQAILSFSSNREAAIAGSYLVINPASGGTGIGSDIWPGDVLALTANGSSVRVMVRRVSVEERGASPEALTYRVAFANDWAEGLGLRVSETIEKDALLPRAALPFVPVVAGVANPVHVLANLQQLTVIGATGTGASSALSVDAGSDAPTGGGFEVRRQDGGFGTGFGGNGDLVLRSPVRGFSIPRAAAVETFFVRMYDGSTKPLYSRESSAIVTHLPIG